MNAKGEGEGPKSRYWTRVEGRPIFPKWEFRPNFAGFQHISLSCVIKGSKLHRIHDRIVAAPASCMYVDLILAGILQVSKVLADSSGILLIGSNAGHCVILGKTLEMWVAVCVPHDWLRG